MKKELEEKLYIKYPLIFQQKDLPMTETCMCWGINTEDGWYFLIDQLCSSIQSYIDQNEHLKIEQVQATQVKEKFAGLRFYYEGGNDVIEGMVHLAENMSYNICEKCGSIDDVTQTKGGWVYTLCKKCIVEKDKKKWIINNN